MTRTAIEWTDETWNPVTGCTKVSAGCDHCYAERITNRFGGPGAFDKVVLHEDRLDQPFHWRKPRRVFVNSMSDLFHNDVPTLFIARVFNVMGANPQHTFQVLTKRPGAMAAMLRAYYDTLGVAPFPNVWLGTSVENQHWADVRIPNLLETPAAVRFLSCEPLLGPVDLRTVPIPIRGPRVLAINQLDWVIVGGESGPGARPMHPDWARALRDRCEAADVPFFFKQWGEWGPAPAETGTWPRDICMSADGDIYEADKDYICAPNESEGEWLRRVGKKRAGRELDSRTWDEFPDVLVDDPIEAISR